MNLQQYIIQMGCSILCKKYFLIQEFNQESQNKSLSAPTNDQISTCVDMEIANHLQNTEKKKKKESSLVIALLLLKLALH